MIFFIEIVSFRLKVHSCHYSFSQPKLVKIFRPQYRPEIHRMLITQTEEQPPLYRDSHPIAVTAKIMRNRGDKSNARLIAFHIDIALRTCCFYLAVGELKALLQRVAYPSIAAGSLFSSVIGRLTKGHFFNKGYVDSAL